MSKQSVTREGQLIRKMWGEGAPANHISDFLPGVSTPDVERYVREHSCRRSNEVFDELLKQKDKLIEEELDLQDEVSRLAKLSCSQSSSIEACHKEIDIGLREIKRLQHKLDERPSPEELFNVEEDLQKCYEERASLCERKGELEEEKEHLKEDLRKCYEAEAGLRKGIDSLTELSQSQSRTIRGLHETAERLKKLWGLEESGMEYVWVKERRE